ncbi:hypothetical protein [Aureimonas leprariae]|uniref:Uncharacterized protein n=1 Tax=Plantimonas leprariae TaxID=2615207 RepID=A0A7V7PKW8_9HYPH|nr:hypothetical protein [Aureimonas leprariae]KAB0676536.1 hypothetical protein F6X38_20840 [Aureimonas leprariae]
MRGISALFVLLGLATAAGAAEPFPGGTFGEKDGCRYARTGESSGADDFLFLNAEGITSSTAFCALKKATAKGKGAFALVLACETEGESGGDETGSATLKNDAWTVTLEDGTHWGPIKRCR